MFLPFCEFFLSQLNIATPSLVVDMALLYERLKEIYTLVNTATLNRFRVRPETVVTWLAIDDHEDYKNKTPYIRYKIDQNPPPTPISVM